MNGFCKACLMKYDDPSSLLQYTEKNRRFFLYSTGLQVKPNDPLPFQICQDCFMKMKLACKFKKQCRTSDKRLSHYLSLKESGEETDLGNYLRTIEGSSLLFKFPLQDSSTPTYQKAKEVDNMSTSTSIRNFMTDILRDDEIPDTEARIIREMIEREADILDDSLDSQWLQDDVSIASDFRFSPFSTPLSKKDEQSRTIITPMKEPPQKQENITVTGNILAAKKLLLSPKSSLETSSNESDNESVTNEQENLNKRTFIAAKKMLLKPTLSSNKSKSTSEKDSLCSNTFVAAKRILLGSNQKCDDNKSLSLAVETETEFALNYSNEDRNTSKVNHVLCDNTENTEMPNENVENNIVNLIDNGNRKVDHIDKNLEKALNTTNDDVFSLSGLLATPSSDRIEETPTCNIIATPTVHQELAGANTPTIENILFGENLSDGVKKEQSDGQGKEDYISSKSNEVDILEDFFNKETGEYVGVTNKKQDEIFEEYTSPNSDLLLPSKMKYDLTDFSCKTCNIYYKSERGLKIHFSKAHKTKILTQRKKEPRVEMPCDRCGRIFNLKSNLTKHVQIMHIAPKRAVTCSLCSIEFSSEGKLKLHMRSHEGKFQRRHEIENDSKKESLVCFICGHLSTTQSNLKTHIARHSKNYSYKCHFCDKGYYRKSDLEIHMRIHMNIKPYKCDKCSASFRRKDQLQLHLVNHKGLQSYTCHICLKAFANSTRLKYHIQNSKRCKAKQFESSLKANKIIEEKIDQFFVIEEQLIGSIEMPAQAKTQLKGSVELPAQAQTIETNDKVMTADDIEIKDATTVAENTEPSVLDVESDRNSLADIFTIPIVIKLEPT